LEEKKEKEKREKSEKNSGESMLSDKSADRMGRTRGREKLGSLLVRVAEP